MSTSAPETSEPGSDVPSRACSAHSLQVEEGSSCSGEAEHRRRRRGQKQQLGRKKKSSKKGSSTMDVRVKDIIFLSPYCEILLTNDVICFAD